MLSRETCHVHTVGVHLGNLETESGRREKAAETRDSPPWSFLPLSAAPLSKGRPAKWTHEKPKEPRKNHFSLISKFLPPRRKQQLRAELEFCSLCPRGSPRWAELPSPWSCPDPCATAGEGTSVSQPSTGQAQNCPAQEGGQNKLHP